MPANRTTLDAALQDLYLSPLQSLLNNNLIEAQITTGSDQVSGRKAVFALHTGRNTGLGAITDGGNLPVAGNQGYNQGATGLTTQVGRIEITNKAIRTISNGSAAFVSEPQAEIDGLGMDAKRDLCRQYFGTGDGVVIAAGVTTGSNTVNVTGGDLAKTGQLQDGMLIDIGTVANPTAVASGRLITGVNTNAAGVVTSIVISGATVTTSATDRIFRSGNGGNQTENGLTFGKEVNGLQNIVSATGVLHTIDPAVVPKWKSYVKDLAGAGLSSSRIMEMAHRVYRDSGTQPGLILTTDGALRVFGDTLTSLKQSTNTVDLKGGFSALSVAIGGGGKDVAVTWDRDVPGGNAFALDPSVIKLHVSPGAPDWTWDNTGGAIIKPISGRDASEAYVVRDMQLATRARNRHARFTNVAEV